jgi:putative heme-binding domain-containing protein
MLTQLASDSSLMGSRSGQKVLGQLAFQVGAANRKDELSQVSAFLKRDMQPGCVFLVARSLADGLQRSKATLDSILDPKPIFSKAKKLASDPATEETTRVEAVQLLGYMPFMEAEPKILPLISVQQPQAVQLAAVQSLRKFSDAAVGRDLMTQWASLTPRVRNDVMAALLERPERVLALLDALAKGQVSKNELSSTQVQFLRAHKNNEVREKASLFLGPAAKPGRQAVVDEFHPALNLNGDPQRGKAIYEQRCASCHRAGTLGFAVGPDLVTVKTTGKEKLLINILDPNREVPANYLTYLLETKGGESFLGILARETGNSVILRQAFGKEETIARASISSMKNQDVSLMPEGLETGLELQGMADLLEFIEKL